MRRQAASVDEAIATLDDWAVTIAEHAANDRNPSRVNYEIGLALSNIPPVARTAMSPAQREVFFRASVDLLDVVQPLMGEADREASNQLRSLIQQAQTVSRQASSEESAP